MENDIVKYIDYKVSTLSPQYPNVDFKLLRENAIQSFSGRTEPLEVLKQYIDAAFMNAIDKLDKKEEVVEEPFVMTPQEERIYEELKQESIARRNAMGLNNSKRLTFENNGMNSNKGLINHLGIIIFVALAVITLLLVVWKFVF